MAQYRKTFFSMGGPERIADPGADELARMVALQLQRQQQAQQAAQAQQRMDQEQRLALEGFRRDDARIDLARQGQAQQASLAERGFGLQERGFAREGERDARDFDLRKRGAELAELLGRGQLDVSRQGLGLQREEAQASERRFQATRGDTRRESAERRRFDSGENRMSRELQERIATMEAMRRMGEREDDRAFTRETRGEDRAYALADLERALGEQTRARDEQQRRDASTAGAGAVANLDLGPIPDDPSVETGWTGGWQNPDADLQPLVERVAAAFGAPTTEEEALAIKAALRGAIMSRFDREAEVQRREGERPFAIDNSEEQATLRHMLLAELDRIAKEAVARTASAPGPQAPNAPRGYTRPAPR